ncbi:MAG: sulfur relay protein DsrC [Gammaproteobacteria bacterium]|nr:sulfur relay protein DsrC [Gammaproteobacteria bacterium]
MLYLSEILMQNHQVENFGELLKVIKDSARASGEIHLHIDVKPTYPDTPDNWEDRIEGAFSGVHSVTDY